MYDSSHTFAPEMWLVRLPLSSNGHSCSLACVLALLAVTDSYLLALLCRKFYVQGYGLFESFYTYVQ